MVGDRTAFAHVVGQRGQRLPHVGCLVVALDHLGAVALQRVEVGAVGGERPTAVDGRREIRRVCRAVPQRGGRIEPPERPEGRVSALERIEARPGHAHAVLRLGVAAQVPADGARGARGQHLRCGRSCRNEGIRCRADSAGGRARHLDAPVASAGGLVDPGEGCRATRCYILAGRGRATHQGGACTTGPGDGQGARRHARHCGAAGQLHADGELLARDHRALVQGDFVAGCRGCRVVDREHRTVGDGGVLTAGKSCDVVAGGLGRRLDQEPGVGRAGVPGIHDMGHIPRVTARCRDADRLIICVGDVIAAGGRPVHRTGLPHSPVGDAIGGVNGAFVPRRGCGDAVNGGSDSAVDR